MKPTKGFTTELGVPELRLRVGGGWSVFSLYLKLAMPRGRNF